MVDTLAEWKAGYWADMMVDPMVVQLEMKMVDQRVALMVGQWVSLMVG